MLLTSAITAQSEVLPTILEPDPAVKAQAERMGAQVFKIVPYEKFYSSSVKPEDNPIGLPGGGGYYSFTTGSHAFSGSSQIQMIRSQRLLTVGLSIGLFINIGSQDLATINLEHTAARYLASYRPPVYFADIRKELSSLHDRSVAGFAIDTAPKVEVGNTYIFRIIRFSEADILGVLQVLSVQQDESVTLAWKKLADFPQTRPLLMRDSELQAKIDALILAESIPNLTVTVRENRLIVSGKCVGDNLKHFLSVLDERGVKHLGVSVEDASCALRNTKELL